jgi:hypothetical protein
MGALPTPWAWALPPTSSTTTAQAPELNNETVFDFFVQKVCSCTGNALIKSIFLITYPPF